MRSPYDYNPGDNMKSELAFSGVMFEKYAMEARVAMQDCMSELYKEVGSELTSIGPFPPSRLDEIRDWVNRER